MKTMEGKHSGFEECLGQLISQLNDINLKVALTKMVTGMAPWEGNPQGLWPRIVRISFRGRK